VSTIPDNVEDQFLDTTLARVAVEIATKRHAGKLERFYTPAGEMYIQRGKDLTEVQQCIGTGGPIVYSIHPETILEGSIYDHGEPFSLLPRHLHFHIDRAYTLYALGLLAETMPDVAIRMMKHYLGFNKKEDQDCPSQNWVSVFAERRKPWKTIE
jgi:uncharacterized protein (TIGR01319 family)